MKASNSTLSTWRLPLSFRSIQPGWPPRLIVAADNRIGHLSQGGLPKDDKIRFLCPDFVTIED
jgi:hypothetical protein